jgi:serine/threonine protein kinase
LTLGQAVALKFLPETLARDERALARFYNEVRIARQVTHPNVCRVYDIGQVEGQHYISMEFVDGEDLASLLRRIGRCWRTKLSKRHEKFAQVKQISAAKPKLCVRSTRRCCSFRMHPESRWYLETVTPPRCKRPLHNCTHCRQAG